MHQFIIEITDHLTNPLVEHEFLRSVVQRVLTEEQVDCATISLALVDDQEIHRINRNFLGHDYATDVISFLLSENNPTSARQAADEIATNRVSSASRGIPGTTEVHSSHAKDLAGFDMGVKVKIEGELVVSTETAIREAPSHGWSPASELLLYIVHGLLHLCGYDDLTDEARPAMRSRERELLAIWNLCPTGLEP